MNLTVNNSTTLTSITGTYLNVIAMVGPAGPQGAIGPAGTGSSGGTGNFSLNGLTDTVNLRTSGNNLNIRPVGNNIYIDITGQVPSGNLTGYVPTYRTVNTHALTGDVTVIAADIPVGIVPGAGYSNLQQFINTMHSPGLIAGATISDVGSGNAFISPGTGMLRVANDDVSSLLFVSIPSTTIAVPADLVQRYVGFVYNGGTPVFEARLTNNWDNDTEIALGTVINFFGTLVVSNNPFLVGDPITNIIQRFDAMAPITRDAIVGGLVLGEVGTRNIALSAGKLWTRLNDYSVPAKDTTGADTMYSAYFNGIYWVYTVGLTQWDNANYNNIASGLTALTAGYYSNLWFYLTVESNALGFFYDQSQYGDQTSASLASPPSFLPDNFTNGSILLGRLLFFVGGASAIEIDSAFTTTFTSSPVTAHNNLAGLQGGAASQYYHLTAGDYTNLTQISSRLTVNNVLGLSGISGAQLNIGSGGSLGTAALTDTAAIQSGYLTTGIADNRYVDLVNDQEVFGQKTFHQDISLEGSISYADFSPNFIRSFKNSDNSYQSIVELQTAQLYSSGTSPSLSLDWQAKQLFSAQSSTIPTLDWQNQILSGEWRTNTTGISNESIINYGRLSTYSGQADNKYYPLATNPSGYLTTGASGSLYQRDLDISGALQTLISNGGAQVKVTGSSSLSTANFTGAGSVVVTLSGSQVLISGSAAGGGITQGQLDSVSGWASGQIALTGSQAWNAANNNGVNLSGNLTQTGVQLTTRDNAISGVIDTRLALTGSGLYSIITGMSGQANTNFATVANLTLTGSGLFSTITGLSGAFNTQIASTGSQAWSAANNNGINLSGNLTQTGVALINRDFLISGILATGIANTGQSLYNLITAFSGQANTNYATVANLALTGSGLYSLVTGMSGQFNTNLALTGSQSWNAANNNGLNLSGALSNSGTALMNRDFLISGILSTGLATTGTTLYGLITALSGQANTNYATIANLALTGSGLYALVTGMSGQDVTNYATKTQLTQSGVDLGGQISSLSGYTNQFLVHRTGAELISGAKTFIYNNAENFIVKSGIANMLMVSGNATKVFLANGTLIFDSNQQVLFDSSANTSVDWATKYLGDNSSVLSVDWQTRTLNNSVGTATANWTNRTLSGPGGVVLNWNTSTLTGEWQTNSVGTASGTIVNFDRLTNVSGALVSQIAGAAGTPITVTGSSVLGAADFTGIGGTVVLISGGKLFISGAAGVGGGVPSVNGITSAVNVIGTGLITVSTAGANVVVSGDTSISGALSATGTALYNLVTAFSGQANTNYATVANLALTGSGLYSLVTGMSGQFNTNLAITGTSAVTHANSIGTTISGNLTSSGVALINRDFLISGILATGIAQTGSSLYNLITAMSGQANANYATIANLALTGSGLYATVTGMSGQFNANLALTGQQAWSAADNNGRNLSGNLTQTGVQLQSIIATSGSNLYNLINNASGQYNTNFATVVNLALTGSGLFTQMTGMSGQFNTNLALTGSQAWNAANNNGINLSGALSNSGTALMNRDFLISGILSSGLASTGSLLSDKINSLSGFTTGASGSLFQRDLDISGALQALIAGGGSVVKVSGSAAIATADFTGIGGTIVIFSGGKVFVSGASAGVGGGVPSINGISSATTITGTGGLQVTTVGSTITISGFNTVKTDQVLFSNGGIISGTDELKWDNTVKTLEVGNPILPFPDNPLHLYGSGVYFQSNLQNYSNKNDASADYVVTIDVGSDTSGYLDLGINNSNYNQAAYDMGAGRDGYLLVEGGDFDFATATTGKKIRFNTAGTRSFNLRASIINSGIQMPATGSVIFSGGLEINSTSVKFQQTGFSSAVLGVSGIAQRPIITFIESGLARSQMVVGPAMWSRPFTAILPATTTSQTVLGNTAANVGTLSTVSSEVMGQYTNIASANTLFAAAGTAATTSYYYRGSMTGRNGFFFTSTFALPDGFDITGAYAGPSGSRIFVGMTDQTTSAAVLTNDPAGNRVGLSYVYCTGGTQANRNDSDWLISTKDNTTQFTGSALMNFKTGMYRFSLYSPPFAANNTGVYWQLDDLIRGSGSNGLITGNLPIGSTALRPSAYLCGASGLATFHNIRVMNVYAENVGGG